MPGLGQRLGEWLGVREAAQEAAYEPGVAPVVVVAEHAGVFDRVAEDGVGAFVVAVVGEGVAEVGGECEAGSLVAGGQ